MTKTTSPARWDSPTISIDDRSHRLRACAHMGCKAQARQFTPQTSRVPTETRGAWAFVPLAERHGRRAGKPVRLGGHGAAQPTQADVHERLCGRRCVLGWERGPMGKGASSRPGLTRPGTTVPQPPDHSRSAGGGDRTPLPTAAGAAPQLQVKRSSF